MPRPHPAVNYQHHLAYMSQSVLADLIHGSVTTSGAGEINRRIGGRLKEAENRLR